MNDKEKKTIKSHLNSSGNLQSNGDCMLINYKKRALKLLFLNIMNSILFITTAVNSVGQK